MNTRLQIQNKKPGYFKKNSKKIILIDTCPLLDENILNFIQSINDIPSVPYLIIKTDNNKNISSNIKQKKLSFSIDDITIQYDYRVFFQTNKFLIQPWLNVIKNFVSSFNKKRIIEFYCGTGIISLYLAKNFNIKKISGVDSDNTAVNFAKINREKNKLFNIKYLAGKAEKIIHEFEYANVVIINPPRAGVPQKVLDLIIKLKPEAIIYSSCEISTFIRDAKILTLNNYSLEKITALDMFPQTHHFETVGLFVR